MAEFSDGDTVWDVPKVGERLVAMRPDDVFNIVWKTIARIDGLRAKRVSNTRGFPYMIFCRDSSGIHTCRLGFMIWPKRGNMVADAGQAQVQGYACEHAEGVVDEILSLVERSSRPKLTIE